MLMQLHHSNINIDRVVCVDTTKEFPQMYDHIKTVRDIIHPVPFDILTIPFDYWFSEHIKTKGKNKGKRGYGWPDFRNRWCTALKRDYIQKYLNALNAPYKLFIGISADEAHRATRNTSHVKNAIYPLVEDGQTGKDNLRYCYAYGFDWGGLYNDFERVSCYCCPLSRMGELETLYRKYPDLWEKVKQMDTKSYRQFKPTYTVSQLAEKFSK